MFFLVRDVQNGSDRSHRSPMVALPLEKSLRTDAYPPRVLPWELERVLALKETIGGGIVGTPNGSGDLIAVRGGDAFEQGGNRDRFVSGKAEHFAESGG